MMVYAMDSYHGNYGYYYKPINPYIAPRGQIIKMALANLMSKQRLARNKHIVG
jgi:hypothetical protein